LVENRKGGEKTFDRKVYREYIETHIFHTAKYDLKKAHLQFTVRSPRISFCV